MSNEISLDELKRKVLGNELYLKTFEDGITDKELDIRSQLIGIEKEDIIEVLNLKKTEKIEQKEDKGLKIGNIILKKLSGPTSFKILIPHKKNKPLIILIGDLHNKISGFCENCRCDNLDDCCLYSFDISFIKLLDGLTNKENPIGIYVEDFKQTKSWKDEDQEGLESYLNEKAVEYKENILHKEYRVGEPLKELKINYGDCFRNLKYQKDCPTKNIHWNYTDTRISPRSYENQIFKYLYFLKRETGIENIILNLFNLDSFGFVKNLLQNKKSIIRKQIVKAGLNIDFEIEKYIKPYFDYVWKKSCMLYDRKNKIININLTTSLTKKLILYFFQNRDISNQQICRNVDFTSENIKSIITLLTSPLVELYSYYRMIKQLKNIIPESTIKSFPLIINILGENHIENYQYFLGNIKEEYFTYWNSSAIKDTDQCILFDLNFDLNNYLPNDIEYIQIKNLHFKIITDFRKYLIGNDYENILNDEILQKRIDIINKKRPDFKLTLSKLKQLTEYDNLINESEINKKILSNQEMDNKLAENSTINNLKFAMKNNNLKATQKILKQKNFELEIDHEFELFIIHNYLGKDKDLQNKKILMDIINSYFKKKGEKISKKMVEEYFNYQVESFLLF
jgi:hypothetical protein